MSADFQIRALHRVINGSLLSKSEKAVLRFIVNADQRIFSFGLSTVAKELRLSERSVRYAIRTIDDSDGGLGILVLMVEAKAGVLPRVYRVVRERITESVLPYEKGAKKAPSRGAFLPPSSLLGAKMPRITSVTSSCVSGAAEQPPSQGDAPPKASVHSIAAARAKREAAKTASLGRGVEGAAL